MCSQVEETNKANVKPFLWPEELGVDYTCFGVPGIKKTHTIWRRHTQSSIFQRIETDEESGHQRGGLTRIDSSYWLESIKCDSEGRDDQRTGNLKCCSRESVMIAVMYENMTFLQPYSGFRGIKCERVTIFCSSASNRQNILESALNDG